MRKVIGRAVPRAIAMMSLLRDRKVCRLGTMRRPAIGDTRGAERVQANERDYEGRDEFDLDASPKHRKDCSRATGPKS